MASPSAFNSTKAQRLGALTQKIFLSDKYSDLTIKCRDRVFKVHGNMLCLQSQPIATAIDGNWKICHAEDEPDIVAHLVQYLYRQDFSPSLVLANGTKITTEEALFVITKVYIIADRYDVAILKEVAAQKFKTRLAKIIIIYPQWQDEQFAKAVKLMYKQTMQSDRALKDIAINFVADHSADMVERPAIRQVCLEVGEFGLDVLVALKNRDQLSSNSPVGGHAQASSRPQWYINDGVWSFGYTDSQNNFIACDIPGFNGGW